MRIYAVILSVLFTCAAYAQDTLLLPAPAPDSLPQSPVIVVDTMSASELTIKADDSYLLDIIGHQTEQLIETAQQAELRRILTDTTTIVPLHLGYSDSLRIAEQVAKQGHTTILCLPQLYRPMSPMPFRRLTYGPEHKDEPAVASLAKDPRLEARRYLTTHAAGLYTGTVDPTKVEKLPTNTVQDDKSLYELSIPQKSLIQDTEADRKERLAAIKNKKNPWFKELSTLLQFTQNYVSPNWYEGGNSAFAMYASAKGKILYDDKKRINWENTGEWVAGFSTVSGDSLRHVNTTDDLLRFYSKLGIKVVQKLFVSATAEFRTQLFRTYNGNANTIKTGPFTPIRINLAVGVDYKPIKGLSMVFSPAAYKFVSAADTVRSNYTSYGIKKGEKLLNQFGSSVRVEWKWKPLREIQLETNLYTYTNYRSVELDLEIICDFIINRFMSTRVMLHPRYDSALIHAGDEKAKIQFKELVSIGFAHKFY